MRRISIGRLFKCYVRSPRKTKFKEKSKMVERIKTFEEKIYTYELAGRPLVVKTGKIAGLANGAALVQYGETTVLATATASAAALVSPVSSTVRTPISLSFFIARKLSSRKVSANAKHPSASLSLPI